jgi:4a-hydroxytetrahydrobiopterin dehydratase
MAGSAAPAGARGSGTAGDVLKDMPMPSGWSERARPQRLERRYTFPDYASLRDFLDRAAELSEREGLYPDLSFGRDYVNVTLHAEEGQAVLSERQRGFAVQLEQLQAQAALD